MRTRWFTALSLALLVPLLGAGRAGAQDDEGGGATWVCRGARVCGLNVWGAMEEGKFLPEFNGTETTANFTDPEGRESGSASWKAPKHALREGETVDISLSATKFTATFEARDCAEGEKTRFTRGVRDPWDPPANQRTFSFVFRPKPGRDAVTMTVMAQPTQAAAYVKCGVRVVWTFERGEPDQVDEPANLTVTDYRQFWNPDRPEGEEPTPLASLARTGSEVKGVAADGVSLLLLRAISPRPGIASFRLDGAGGALYQHTGDRAPFESVGSTTLDVPTEPLPGGEHAALALYRPPSSFGDGPAEKDLRFSVSVMAEGGGAGPTATCTKRLVRPPVVLVHGTYDNPRFCWEDHDEADDTPMNLAPRLRAAGFTDVCAVDWEDTNGSKDPSAFRVNQTTVWKNRNGIRDALAAMRARFVAVTQADLVCHSQGGVIARVYARGFSLEQRQPPLEKDDYGSDEPYHSTDPDRCRKSGCWYHTADSYSLGSIHRLVTISTTHRGSDVCRLFDAFSQYPNESVRTAAIEALVRVFCMGVDSFVSGITTGGFKDQLPGSPSLRAIGPTPVPAHAIACCATDEDMAKMRPDTGVTVTNGLGNYYGKLFKVWLGTPDEAKEWAFNHLADVAREKEGDLGPTRDAQEFKRLNDALRAFADLNLERVIENGKAPRQAMDDVINQMRKTVFRGDENDCTVAVQSSFGRLDAPFRTKVDHALHGWAPRYRAVQDRVLALLRDDGGQFDPNGFPDAYTDRRTRASQFFLPVDPPKLAPGALGPRRPDDADRPGAGEHGGERDGTGLEDRAPPATGPAPEARGPRVEPGAGTEPGAGQGTAVAGAWTGSWNTGAAWGLEPLLLTQTGKDVKGSFAGGKGTLVGTVKGNVLTFTYRDDRMETTGKGTITMSDDLDHIEAEYREDGERNYMGWSMQARRIKK